MCSSNGMCVSTNVEGQPVSMSWELPKRDFDKIEVHCAHSLLCFIGKQQVVTHRYNILQEERIRGNGIA